MKKNMQTKIMWLIILTIIIIWLYFILSKNDDNVLYNDVTETNVVSIVESWSLEPQGSVTIDKNNDNNLPLSSDKDWDFE
jgi:hypothetical protein